MPAGINCAVDFIRLTYTSDDDVGGSVPTGTVLHSHVSARIEEAPTRTDFLQQGLETKKIFAGLFWGYDLDFREQDEVEIVSPPNHKYFGKRFRIVSQTEPNNHPAQKRNYHLAKLERSQIAHTNPYQ
jgi:hypothetical protein